MVSDTIILTIGEGARPGKYALRVGLYNASDGMRLPVRDQAGTPAPGDQIVLTGNFLLP